LNGTLVPDGVSSAGWFEWGTTTSLGKRTDPQIFSDGSATITLVASIGSLNPHTTYYFRVVLYRVLTGAAPIDGDIKSFTTTEDATSTTTAAVSAATADAIGLTSNTATLNGTVNPGGGSVTTWFDWGTSTSLGRRTDVQTVPAGTTAVPVSFSLKSLQPHTVYYFRLDAYRSADGSAALGDIKTFTTSDAPPAAPLTVTTTDATSVTSTSATLNAKITAAGTPFGAWFEYGTTSALGTRTDVQTFPDSTTNVNLTQTVGHLLPGTTYYFRAVAYRGAANPNVLGDILSFTTTASDTPGTLSITASEASAITSTSAILKASTNTGGTPVVGFFEWGTTTSLGSHTDLQQLPGGTGVTFVQTLNNLQPNTTYYFRAVIATSNTSNVVRADIKNFTTGSGTPASLSVTTYGVSDVSSSSARLQGLIKPAGGAVTAWFEWGTTSSLSNQTTSQSFSGTDPSNFSFTLPDLQPNTQYYFRAVGQNSSGTVRGDVKTFTTTRVPSTPPEKITDVETGQIKSGYLIITPDASSDAPTVTFTYGTVSQGSVQSQAGIIPTMMATDASMFVEVIPSISRNIGVAIANPGGTVNAITLTLRDESGIVLGSPANISVPAHQQVAKFVSEVFGADVISNGFRGSLRMQSSTPFAVAGLRFSGSIFSTLPVAITASVPGVPTITLTAGTAPNSPAAGTVGGTTAVIVPQFAIAGGWATQIALVNNTSATLVGRIDIFDTTGTPMPVDLNGETRSTFTYSIPVGGTFVLAPRDSNGQSPL
jgi:phosphodiesterase/alkaline phosphatase D-like protein